MKKILAALVAFAFVAPTFAADEAKKDEPAKTEKKAKKAKKAKKEEKKEEMKK